MSGQAKTIFLGAMFALATVAMAQAQHSGHGSPSTPAGAETPASKELNAANEKMHKDMAIKFSGDADADFINGMIPHHQGAVDMARVVLKYGKDPEVKKLAEEVIRTQEAEISFMRGWLKKNGK